MELKDTIEMMNSENFQERFKAEYWQTKIRYDKLHEMVVKYDAWDLDFEPKCSIELFKNQLEHMRQYLYILEVRAEIEGIKLKGE